MNHEIRRRSRVQSLVIACMLFTVAACGGSGDSTQPPDPSSSVGSLAVTVTGLPTDVAASVSVTGPNGYAQTFGSTRTLTGLTPGSYTVTSARIADRGIGYAAPTVNVTVAGGGSATAAAAYTLRILPRSGSNRTDESTSARFKLLYLVPSDGADRGLDTNGTIHRTISSGQRWLASQTGGRSIRYDVADGGLDITFVRLPRTDAQYFSYGGFLPDSAQKDLRAAGFSLPNVLLLAYYDGRQSTACASAAWPPNYPGTLGAVYLRGLPTSPVPCASNQFVSSPTGAPGYLEFLAQHEVFHLLGLVSTGAPNHALSGHVGTDPTDLMYAGPQPWRPATVDVSKTNYYNPSSLPGAVTNFINSPYVVAAP